MMQETDQSTPPPPNAPTTFASLSSIITDAKNHTNENNIPQCQPTNIFTSVSVSSPRNEVLTLAAAVGNLCHKVLTLAPLDMDTTAVAPPEDNSLSSSCSSTSLSSLVSNLSLTSFWDTPSDNRQKIYDAIASVFACLVKISVVCCVDFRTSILKKIDLNGRKYPVELCKGKSGKYTAYSVQTGITKTNQSTLDISIPQDDDEHSSSGAHSADKPSLDTVPAVNAFIRKFAMDRNWPRYHTPRNITLALLGEAGELAELFQWLGDQAGDDGGYGLLNTGWKEQDVDSVQQELADVAIYCLRLADVVGIEDLGRAVLDLYNN